MYWAWYVLLDQEFCGGGMRSTQCPSSFLSQRWPLDYYKSCDHAGLSAYTQQSSKPLHKMDDDVGSYGSYGFAEFLRCRSQCIDGFPHLMPYTKSHFLSFRILSFTWNNWLRIILLGLYDIIMPSLQKNLLTFSDSPATYGMVTRVIFSWAVLCCSSDVMLFLLLLAFKYDHPG